nr:PAS domain-containing sensor histidine kinase [uncultured Pedobacter sp.]
MIKSSLSANARYFKEGGEMGDLTRNFDWSKSVLGSPEKWPQSLLTTVNIILRSKFPMFLWWGKELIQFYNDAYRPSLGNDGKHPAALGQQAVMCWQEIWPTIQPLIDQVMTGGDSTWSEDQLIPIYRNGRMEDVYWTFSYSGVDDGNGEIGGVLVICTETTKKVNAYYDIEHTKEELEFAIEAAELGTWDLNPQTNRFIGNQRLKSWFGLSVGEEVDLSNATAVIAESDRQRVMDAIIEAMKYKSGGHYDIDYVIQSPNNPTPRHVRAKGKALFNANQQAIRFSGILQDITEQKKDEVRKNDFIAMVSHELKTPLTSLKAYVQLLMRKTNIKSDEFSAATLIKLDTQVNKMAGLINGFLDVSRLDSGKIHLDKKVFLINDLILEVIENFSIPLVINAVHFDPGPDLKVMADWEKIGQVIDNLISNAIKYTIGAMPVVVSCHREEDKAVIRVADQGLGIKQSDLPHLFERFYRVEDEHGRSISGFGIGLYLCAELIHFHNGEIYVESELGKGSVFSFSLPLSADRF